MNFRGILKKAGIVTLVGVLLFGTFLLGGWRERQSKMDLYDKYPLLSKRIFIENANDAIINFEALRSKLRDDVSFYGDENAAVYFEYLPTGTSIRVGDNTQFIGASLVKLPYVMNLYRLAEEKTINLDDRVALKDEWLDDSFGDLYKKGAGYEMTIREIAASALEQSDNTAINAVQDLVKEHGIDKDEGAFSALDVDFTDSESTELRLSARAYSSFLKCLYFACFVSYDSSQDILKMLTHTTVGQDRIIKYLPTTLLQVAHKMGVVGQKTQSDCGIVYLTKRNYTLCIMVNDSQQKGSEFIAEVSKHIYDYVSQVK